MATPGGGSGFGTSDGGFGNGDGLDGGRGGDHRDDDGVDIMDFCGSSNPLARDGSLFPAAASALAKVWKEQPAGSHRWTSSLGGVDLDDEVWDVMFHLDGKDNLERQLGRSDITYMNLLAILEIEGYGWGDNMYYVREEGADIAGMALIKSMVNVEEMLAQYESAQCVSITVIKGKSGLPADINKKQCEEQIPIFEIGVPVVYSVDMQGVLFGFQQSNENEDDSNYHLVHVDTEQDYVLTQQSQVPVIPIDSDDDDLNEKIIDLKKKRPAETFKKVENYSDEEDLFNDSDEESEDSDNIIEIEKKVKKPRTGPTTRSHYGEASTNLPEYLPSSGEDTNYVDDLASGDDDCFEELNLGGQCSSFTAHSSGTTICTKIARTEL
ncbi:hypothetical protein ACQ4PT_005330 [Festuca glaucescens]